jgi:hypothetical protein
MIFHVKVLKFALFQIQMDKIVIKVCSVALPWSRTCKKSALEFTEQLHHWLKNIYPKQICEKLHMCNRKGNYN